MYLWNGARQCDRKREVISRIKVLWQDSIESVYGLLQCFSLVLPIAPFSEATGNPDERGGVQSQ